MSATSRFACYVAGSATAPGSCTATDKAVSCTAMDKVRYDVFVHLTDFAHKLVHSLSMSLSLSMSTSIPTHRIKIKIKIMSKSESMPVSISAVHTDRSEDSNIDDHMYQHTL